MFICREKAQKAQKKALGESSRQKHTYLMGICHDPQMGCGVCQPSHGPGVPGVAGDARPRRPCAGQPAHFAYSHPHYHKLASNINEVKCGVQHPSSFPWPVVRGPCGFRCAALWANRLCRAQTPIASQPTCQRLHHLWAGRSMGAKTCSFIPNSSPLPSRAWLVREDPIQRQRMPSPIWPEPPARPSPTASTNKSP